MKDALSLEVEKLDPHRASAISIKIVAYKASPHAKPEEVPRRLHFHMRFFSFPEVKTDVVSLADPGVTRAAQEVRPGNKYYLAKDRAREMGAARHFQR